MDADHHKQKNQNRADLPVAVDSPADNAPKNPLAAFRDHPPTKIFSGSGCCEKLEYPIPIAIEQTNIFSS